MGERSLAQVAHDAYWRATSSVVTPWDEVQGMFKGAWAAAAAACAQQEREATETQRLLATKFERRCTELEATVESGRSMNAVLRTQLAEAKDEAATLRGQLSSSQQEAQALRAQLAEARELREGRATWVTDGDEMRRLVVRSVVETEVGCVGPTLSEKASWQVEYGSVEAEGLCCIEPGRDLEQAMCRAQRIVEAVAGVRP